MLCIKSIEFEEVKLMLGVSLIIIAAAIVYMVEAYISTYYKMKAGKAHDFNRGRCQIDGIYYANRGVYVDDATTINCEYSLNEEVLSHYDPNFVKGL